MENIIDTNFEFINPDEDGSEGEIKLYIDTENEVCELRKMLHKVGIFAQTEDSVENMLAWTEMGITLAYAIKNLQAPIDLPLDCCDLLNVNTNEENEDDENE